MDVTTIFKACVKTVNLRSKDTGFKSNNSQIWKKNRPKSGFYIQEKSVVTQITKLKEFLLENRKAYLNFSNRLTNVPRMTDTDRDNIDSEAQKIMTTCSQLIKKLKREVESLDTSQQNLEHREIVLVLMEGYLKSVCKIYSEQKAIRVKKAIELRKIGKLRGDKSNLNSIDYESKNSSRSSPMKIQEINGDMNSLQEEETLSAEDIQLFESENEQLFNELNMLTEEMRQIENKVVHIAELQEIFTEKVLDQDKNLDRLTSTVVGSTENVKEANEQIRQAIQRNAGLRVGILFFLLVMSFSLLFLDWYNP